MACVTQFRTAGTSSGISSFPRRRASSQPHIPLSASALSRVAVSASRKLKARTCASVAPAPRIKRTWKSTLCASTSRSPFSTLAALPFCSWSAMARESVAMARSCLMSGTSAPSGLKARSASFSPRMALRSARSALSWWPASDSVMPSLWFTRARWWPTERRSMNSSRSRLLAASSSTSRARSSRRSLSSYLSRPSEACEASK